jgi:hypothetical protein
MPQPQTIDPAVLERTCVQFSGPISHAAPQEELRLAERYLRTHATRYPLECALGLVYRVATSDEKEDRVAAWLLLDSGIRLGIREQNGIRKEERERRKMAKEIEQQRINANGIAAAYGGGAAETLSSSLLATSITSADEAAAAAGRGNGSFAALLDAICRFLPDLMRYRWDETFVKANLQTAYRAMRKSWEQNLSTPIVGTLRAAAEAIRDPKIGRWQSPALDVDERYVDACWKLRRQSPRPSSALYVARLFRITAAEGRAIAQGTHRHAEMHPRVVEWVTRFFNEKMPHCARCDVWTHAASTCPCTPEHVQLIKAMSVEDAQRTLTKLIEGRADAFGAKTLRTAERVLDEVTHLIASEQPFEHVLSAFDTLRRCTTSAASRSAMHLLASYKLTPSKLIDFSGADDVSVGVPERRFSDTENLRRVMDHLRLAQRRLREAWRLRRAIEVLALEFVGAITAPLQQLLRDAVSNSWVVFAAVGHTSWTPKRAVRRPQNQDAVRIEHDTKEALKTVALLPEAAKLQPYADAISVLCRGCLGARHDTSSCPAGPTQEPHDFAALRKFMRSEANIDCFTKEWRNDLDAAVRRLENYGMNGHVEVDSEDAPKHARLRLAQAVLGTFGDSRDGVPFCGRCKRLGHDRNDCFTCIMEALAKANLSVEFVQLLPHLARTVIAPKRKIESVLRRVVETGVIPSAHDPEDRIKLDALDADRSDDVQRILDRFTDPSTEGRVDSSLRDEIERCITRIGRDVKDFDNAIGYCLRLDTTPSRSYHEAIEAIDHALGRHGITGYGAGFVDPRAIPVLVQVYPEAVAAVFTAKGLPTTSVRIAQQAAPMDDLAAKLGLSPFMEPGPDREAPATAAAPRTDVDRYDRRAQADGDITAVTV